jgi:hypothetical protein
MSILTIIFCILLAALVGSLFMALHCAYGKPDNTPPAFPNQTNADIYRGL